LDFILFELGILTNIHKKINLLVLLVAILAFNMSAFAQGQCLTVGGCTGGSNFPSGDRSTTTDSWTTVSTLIYAGEFAYYNVTSGQTYEWSLCATDGGSSSYDAQLTLLNETGVTRLCYSDDYCGMNPKIEWTANITGRVRVLVNQFSCATNSTATTLVWRCASCGSGSAPANDNCSGAIALTVNAAATNGTIVGATNSLVTGCAGTPNNDVWYKFVATSAAYHTVTVVGSSGFDAVVDVCLGACNGTNIACADNTGTGGTEMLTLSGLTNGATYYVRVYDYFSGSPSTNNFTIKVESASLCTPTYTTGTSFGDFIDDVKLGTINNTATGSTSGHWYNDYYDTHSTSVQAGVSYTLQVKTGTYGGQTIAAWIDYNNNNIFEAGEKLGEVANVDGATTINLNFTIPPGTAAGNKRMRVRSVWSQTGICPVKPIVTEKQKIIRL